jgi:hypothetical protein
MRMTLTRPCLRISSRRVHRRRPSFPATIPSFLMTLFLAAACSGAGPFEVYGVPSRSISIKVGQEVNVQMGTVGPGEYVSPPTLGGSAIAFLGVTTPTPVPSGVEQLFHFKGVARGQAIISFHNTNPPGADGVHPDVIDTVNVR